MQHVTKLTERERREYDALSAQQQRAYRHLRESAMDHDHALAHAQRPAATAPGTAAAAQQRIVIDLYDHSDNAELLDVLDSLDALGFSHEPRLERDAGSGWRTIDRRELKAFAEPPSPRFIVSRPSRGGWQVRDVSTGDVVFDSNRRDDEGRDAAYDKADELAKAMQS